jgi:hypothetical protein
MLLKDIAKRKLRENPTVSNYKLALLCNRSDKDMTFNAACWRARYELLIEEYEVYKIAHPEVIAPAPIDPPKVAKSVPKPVKNDWKPDDF